MCHSGKCNYEQSNGGCAITSLDKDQVYPDDALCSINDRMLEEMYREEEHVEDLLNQYTYTDDGFCDGFTR